MAMEDVLKCLIRDSQALGRGYLHIKESSQVALELLETQTGLLQNPPHELREKCFTSLHGAIMSNSGHMLRLGLLGLQKLLRDNQFVSTNCDPSDDQQWLISQILKCLLFPNWLKVSEEVLIELCKIYMNFACLEFKYLNLNTHVMVDFLTRCLDMGLDSGGIRTHKLHLAIQTCAVQNLKTFSIYATTKGMGSPQNCDVNQIIPIMQFLCDKLEDGLSTSQSFPVQFSLESILALLSNLPDGIELNSKSQSFVWRTLCPTLLKLIGVPHLNGQIDYNISELRCVACIGYQLLRLFGNVSSLRAPLESLFHRYLKINKSATRLELFRVMKEMFSNSQRLLLMSGPFLLETPDAAEPTPEEFGIMRILFDSMEENVKDRSTELKHMIIICCNGILLSLLDLTSCPSQQHMPDIFMEKINALYPDLESCDYIGTLSYPTRLRMPKSYEQLLKDGPAPSSTFNQAQCDPCKIASFVIEEGNGESTVDGCDGSSHSSATEGPQAHDVESMDSDFENDTEKIELFHHHVVFSNHTDLERLAARNFLQDLKKFLPNLHHLRSPFEVDVNIQKFASEYCEGSHEGFVVFNADGIYLTTYVTLLLNFELTRRGYYPSCCGFVSQSEDDFIASVLNSGILVYLTSEFLAEIYQGILVTNIMGEAGFGSNENPSNPLFSSCTLINLLTDVRQVKATDHASCFLSDCRKLNFALAPNFILKDPRRQAGLKFARRLLTCFWDSFLYVYSNGISSFEVDSDNHSVSLTLEGLENAAKLANSLGLQDRSGTIFALLASVACGSPRLGNIFSKHHLSKRRLTRARLAGLISKPVLDVEYPHILSLNVVLNKGLELASYNKEAWTHILRCCLYVAELERRIYQSRQINRFKLDALKQYASKLTSKLGQPRRSSDDLNFSSAAFGGLDDNESSESYSFLTAASQLPNNDSDVQQLLEKSIKSESSGSYLDEKLVAQIVSLLSDRVDLLMEDAAAKLNLKSLLLLIEELCHLCHMQLCHLNEENINLQCHWVLHRIGEVMLRSVKTGRPLFHALHCWAMIGPTLLKAASNSDPAIAKTSVEILRSIISHVLQEQPEPRYFHFNEALFKPFENLLSRETYDSDLQDQVVSSLCELVECWSSDIRSGWRPLFACLRRWPPRAALVDTVEVTPSETISPVKDVANSFVLYGSTNSLIFANAAMDAILCQLHYLKSYRSSSDLSHTALDFLRQFSIMLAKMCSSEQIPVFYSAMSLTFLPNECEYETLRLLAQHQEDIEDIQDHWAILLHVERAESGSAVKLWQHPSGIYKVYYLLVDGIMCSITQSKDQIQKSIGECVMSILSFLVDIREFEFVVLCLRCSVLPGMSHWLNFLEKNSSSCELSNFKQECGLLCEIVAQLLTPAASIDAKECTALFRQTTLLYLQCAIESDESLVRIGNSCFRHLLLHCGDHFDAIGAELWAIAASALSLMVRCNLATVQRLIRTGEFSNEPGALEGQLFRVQHLSQQIFNLAAVDPLPQAINTSSTLTALLSYQLANNTIINIIHSNTTSLPIREIFNEAMFAENMGKFAAVEANILTMLCDVLKSCCEFGIDFEMAIAVRRKLQQLLGLSQLPSLNRVTELSSTLLVVGLINFPRPIKELEQWLEFLINLYLQQSNRNDRYSRENSPISELECEHNVIYYDPMNEQVDDGQTTPPDTNENSRLHQLGQEETEGCQDVLGRELESRSSTSSPGEQNDILSKKIQQLHCKENETCHFEHQPVDAVQTPDAICPTQPISPQQTEKSLPEAQLIKDLLLSALNLISDLPRADGQCYSSFENIRQVLIRVHCQESVETALYQALNNFLQTLP